MKRLLIALLATASFLGAEAQITLQINTPEYGFNELANATPYISIIQNNQPGCTSTSSYSIDGSNNIIVVGTCSGLTTGGTAWLTGTGSFNTVGWALEGIPFVMTAAGGTGFTAVYPGGHSPVSSTSLAATVQQNSGVNLSISATTGGGTATFTDATHTAVSTLSGVVPVFQLNIGSTQGNCTGSGTSHANWAVASTVTVTIHAQSVDNPAITNDAVVNICQDTPQVIVVPHYQQAYKNQNRRTVQSWVPGTINQSVTWAITAQPAGGVATLNATTNRGVKVSGLSVTGEYTICATSVSDATKNSCGMIYVSTKDFSTLGYTITPNQTEPTECAVDPTAFSNDYEIGPGLAYANLTATPAANTITAGSIFRMWNKDTTGTSPTTYNEYYQMFASGTFGHPNWICGVPDSAGNLLVMDGANAGGQAGISNAGTAAGVGIISVYGGGFTHGAPFGTWGPPPTGSFGNYTGITGIHFIHASTVYNYIPPGGGSPTPYFSGASCIRAINGAFIWWQGNDLDTCANGAFTGNNSSNGWAITTLGVGIRGNYIHNFGRVGDGGTHGSYLQSNWLLFEANHYGPPLTGMLGGATKWRGVGLIHRYNRHEAGTTREVDMIENQDGFGYQSVDGYFDQGWFNFPDGLGINGVVGYNESSRLDLIYGDSIDSSTSNTPIHFGADVEQGMNDRNGKLYFYNNTMYNGNGGFDNCGNGDGFNPILANNIYYYNNAMYGTSASSYQLNHCSEFIGHALTNMFQSPGPQLTSPILGGNHLTGQPTDGWVNSCDTSDGVTGCVWQLQVPLQTHQYGLSSGNFLTASSLPYNSSTFVPNSGSPLINAGTDLSTLAVTSENPVEDQWDTSSNFIIPRLNPLTIGGVDSGSPPTVVSIALTPNPITLTVGSSVTLVCTTTLSDSTTRNCISPSLSSTSGSVSFSGLTVLAVSVGSGTINGSAESHTTTDNFTVSALPPSVQGVTNSLGVGTWQ